MMMMIITTRKTTTIIITFNRREGTRRASHLSNEKDKQQKTKSKHNYLFDIFKTNTYIGTGSCVVCLKMCLFYTYI
jgi:hypothetical protein